jgi:ATP phosphoribosyltransferase, regulatory subunit
MSKSKQNKNIPEGTRDIIYEEAKLYTAIFDKFSEVYDNAGFKQIITPAIEYYDVFDYVGQSINQEEMYKLTDNNGRLIVLRADNTTPAARVAATRLRNSGVPQKLYYNQNVYRITGDYSGKRNEIFQSGVEIIGCNGIKNDLICIMTAIDTLKTLNIKFKIEIGHVGYFNALINELQISADDAEIIRSYVNNKNAVSLNVMNKIKDYDKIRRIPFLFGGVEVFDEAEKLADGNDKALQALNYVRELYELLNSAGYSDNIMIDMGIVHQIDYYTGVVFGGYIEGAGEPVLTGGRYDNLINNFDYDVPATGFAINVCLVADAIKSNVKNVAGNEYIIHFTSDKIYEAVKFHQLHGGCEYSGFDTYDETVNYAKAKNIRYIVNITENGTEVNEL